MFGGDLSPATVDLPYGPHVSECKVVIVGGGPAGSSCAIRLAMAGIASTIVECEEFPRFHIGESLLAETGVLLREMGLEDEMDAVGFPEKHAVRISTSGRKWYEFPMMRRLDNGGLESSHTWQVRRSVFDKLLLDRAVELGATLLRGTAENVALDENGVVTGLKVKTVAGSVVTIPSDVLVDASGQKTFLSRLGLTGPKERGEFDRRIAVFSHYAGMIRADECWGDTLVYFERPDRWAWFIPIEDDVTSVGVVCGADYFAERGESREEFLERELEEFNPDLTVRAANRARTEPVRTIANYGYEVWPYVGAGWLCVGDAHRFVDPLFSFGVNVALSEAKAAASTIVDVIERGADACRRRIRAVRQVGERRWRRRRDGDPRVYVCTIPVRPAHKLAAGRLRRPAGRAGVDGRLVPVLDGVARRAGRPRGDFRRWPAGEPVTSGVVR